MKKLIIIIAFCTDQQPICSYFECWFFSFSLSRLLDCSAAYFWGFRWYHIFSIADICFRTNHFLILGPSIFAVACWNVFNIQKYSIVHAAQLLRLQLFQNHYYQFIRSYANWNDCPTNISSSFTTQAHTHTHTTPCLESHRLDVAHVLTESSFPNLVRSSVQCPMAEDNSNNNNNNRQWNMLKCLKR